MYVNIRTDAQQSGDNTTTPPGGIQRTVVFVEYDTMPGQRLFVRGGINHHRRPGLNDMVRHIRIMDRAISPIRYVGLVLSCESAL